MGLKLVAIHLHHQDNGTFTHHHHHPNTHPPPPSPVKLSHIRLELLQALLFLNFVALQTQSHDIWWLLVQFLWIQAHRWGLRWDLFSDIKCQIDFTPCCLLKERHFVMNSSASSQNLCTFNWHEQTWRIFESTCSSSNIVLPVSWPQNE